MRGLIQSVCILVIAAGAGLLAFSNKLEPQLDFADPAALARAATMSYEDRDQHYTASVTGGIGVGLMVLGTLALVLPWINQLGTAVAGELGDNSARTISTIAIWLSVAIVLTFGVFAVSWTGTAALSVVLIIVAIICTAATITSAMVCGWKPYLRATHSFSEPNRPE